MVVTKKQIDKLSKSIDEEIGTRKVVFNNLISLIEFEMKRLNIKESTGKVCQKMFTKSTMLIKSIRDN